MPTESSRNCISVRRPSVAELHLVSLDLGDHALGHLRALDHDERVEQCRTACQLA